MTPSLLQRFQHLVSARTGLHIRQREREAFQATLSARMITLKLPEPEQYYQLLASSTARAEEEWPELASRLTNRESYFFRDKGQMALLREQILPELIERNRSQRSLRLWSAGCSTGEEPYSLAMLVDGLLPRRDGWQILIFGTDLNPKTVAQAEGGIYSLWSFRMVEPALQQRYFRRVQEGWEIAASIRRMVTFRPSNLVHDLFPDRRSGLCEMDLILCRNVFIYFERVAVPVVVRKLVNTLREGGYLITGHAEIDSRPPEGLQPRKFPEALVYQRVKAAMADNSGGPPEPSSRTVGSLSAAPEVSRPGGSGIDRPKAKEGRLPAEPQTSRRDEGPAPGGEAPDPASLLEAAETLYTRGDYGAVIASLEPLLQRQPDHYPALSLLVQSYTNRGQPATAAALCRRASEANPMAAAAYQLLAALGEDQGDYEEAKRLLKQVIYLSPTSAAAYLDLGALYAREGERGRARKMRSTALELLLRLPPDTPVEPSGGPTAGEWVIHVKGLLAEGD